MRIVEQNILAGGSNRIARLISRVAEKEPDIVILTEFRLSNIDRLVPALRDRGLSYSYQFADDPKRNGVLIASRVKLIVEDISPVGDRRASNYLLKARLPSFDLICAYIPQHKDIDTEAYFKALGRSAATSRCLLVGDLNVGDSEFDGYGYRFRFEPWYQEMLSVGGLVDAYRALGGDRTTTWKHPRGKREGFRIDHVLASGDLIHALHSVSYDHDVRAERLSDHSMLIVDVLPVD